MDGDGRGGGGEAGHREIEAAGIEAVRVDAKRLEVDAPSRLTRDSAPHEPSLDGWGEEQRDDERAGQQEAAEGDQPAATAGTTRSGTHAGKAER